ncbi:restriction endonuclease subunit S [Novilysobacter avium]|uniref:Restriction endonuclease subunit S n=1 Tax=Novilysobacter avium TaxID=2781023 RepID=A0A7S6UK79_9GAMM|nr:restriction endonuclease subunit S [Lysobacter avium]QOW21766.1 restriction endonuclease subunit S [Lysobacter avium]
MSLPRYPAYRDSGVDWLGTVPSHWQVDRLKAAITSCKNGIWGEEPKGDDSDIDCVRVADFDRARLVVDGVVPTQRSVTQSERAGRTLQRDNLLLEKSGGGERQPVGQVVLYDRDEPAVCSNFVAKVTLAEGMAPRFWMYQHAAAYAYGVNIVAIKQTSGIQNLDQSQYFNERGVFPSYAEQVQIARFLDRETAKIDALIAEQEKLLALLAEKRQATISRAVTRGLDANAPMMESGTPWLGRVPAHWEVRPLKKVIASAKAGPFGSALTKDMYCASGYRVYGQEQVIPADFTLGDYFIGSEKYSELQQYAVTPGDILISCVGTFGKVAIVPEGIHPGVINPRLIRLRSRSHVLAEFLVTVLRSNIVFEQFSLLSRGGTMDVINIGTLNGIQIAVPPLSEQGAVCDFVVAECARIDRLGAEAKRSASLLRERRTALIAAAVTGQIDVRGAVEAEAA